MKLDERMRIVTRFEQTCPDCRGDSYVQHPEWREFWQRRNPETSYADYLRSNNTPDVPEEIPCNTCNGQGLVPTAEGLELLQFMARHLQLQTQFGYRPWPLLRAQDGEVGQS